MQENENNINYNINNIDIDMDDPNLTGSDIDDPKYIPSNNILENNKLLNSNLENKNEEMFLKTKLISLQNDANFSNQKRQELLNKNLQLKQELAKLKENIKTKKKIKFKKAIIILYILFLIIQQKLLIKSLYQI